MRKWGGELKEIMAGVPNYVGFEYANFESNGIEDPNTGVLGLKRLVLVIGVSKAGWGFGQFSFVANDEGTICLDTERSDKQAVKDALCALVDKAITDWDEDPEKHRTYNKIMRRTCGEHCKICWTKTSNASAPESTP